MNVFLQTSEKNTRREAQRWAARLEVFPRRDQVVLGLGLGQHLIELAKMTDNKIFVIDPRPMDPVLLDQVCNEFFLRDRLCCGTFDEIFPLLRKRQIQVQLFRPCWDRLDSEFLKMRDRLNGRTAIENRLTSMKDIVSEKNEICLLQELVR